MDELRRAGLLHFEIDLDNRAFGMNVQAMLWLSVEPGRLDETGRALASHREIPFAAATTGPTNLLASAAFRDTRHLYQYLTGELAALPGVSSVADRADHPDPQADRLSALAGPPRRRSSRRPAAGLTAAGLTAAGWSCRRCRCRGRP